ncbi:MFS transporter [Luteolibacter algae]|uniref:MFS transporter n=1 Tax=Luteolibacter algae TaxID=454151 RepID=A0ABW5D8P9_9BACT
MNLRPAITAISPLAERMYADGLSRQLIGSLTAIPLLLFSLVGFWAGWIGQRIGFARALGLGMALLAFGCAARSFTGDFSAISRILGTVFIGSGIALGNVLLPGLVKSRFPQHMGVLTSLYATGMNLGAALGIALAVPMANSLPGGWNASLGMWGVAAFSMLILWAPQMFTAPQQQSRRIGHPLAGVMIVARKRRAWHVTIFMGLQSAIYYSTVAWLPTMLQSRGMAEELAAGWVSALQITGCVASLVIPMLAVA